VKVNVRIIAALRAKSKEKNAVTKASFPLILPKVRKAILAIWHNKKPQSL
jgi:hypothetical protein